MPGLDPGLVVHSLNVDPGMRPVVQPTRVFHTEVEAQIVQEVKKIANNWFYQTHPTPKMAFQHCTCEEEKSLSPTYC